MRRGGITLILGGWRILKLGSPFDRVIFSRRDIARISISLIALVFAILYQTVDWPRIFEEIYNYPMIDRAVYERQIVYHDLRVDYIDHFSAIEYFTSEWLWGSGIAYVARDLGIGHEATFFIITTFVLWRFGSDVIRHAGIQYLPFLLNPLVVDYAFSQLRVAFAIAVLSFFWRGQYGRFVTIAAYVVCSSIHTSVVLFAAMHFAASYFRYQDRRSLITLVLVGAIIAVMIGPLRGMILSSLGDRRAEYHDMSSSTLYLSFWILMLAFMIYDWRSSLLTLDGRYSLIILSIVMVNVLTGGYSTRFIAAAFPSLLIAMASYRSKPVSLLSVIFVPYAVVQWLFWLRIM